MKKFISLVILAAIIVAGIVFIPQFVHTCDDCGKLFIGVGYEPNIVENLLSNEEQIICKKCAEEQHAVSIVMGKSVDDYKRDIFK